MLRALIVGVLAGTLIGVLVGALAAAQLAPPRVEVLHGYSLAVNHDGTAVGLAPDRASESGGSFSIAGAAWRSHEQPAWRLGAAEQGHPTCVEPLSRGQELRLGVVDVPATGGAPGGTVTAWVECLSDPTERYENSAGYQAGP